MSGHTYTNTLHHVVFSTKLRAPAIAPEFRARLHEYMAGLANHEFGAAVKIGGTENHVHGLLSIRADVALAEAVRKWKSLSSKWVHETLRRASFGWQSGYAAFSVSPSRSDAVMAYIQSQEQHHHRRTFEEEYVALLKRAGISFDPKYVFD